MTTEVIAAIVGAFIGGLFTVLAVALQRGRKLIIYGVSSMPLLRFKPLDDMLRVAADKSILSGDPADKGTFEQINNVYGFEIELINSGNEDIENPIIEIQVDKVAKIISYETQPSSKPGYNITIQKDVSQNHIIRVTIPYINKKDIFLVRIISTGNTNKKCDINVIGLGVKYKKSSTLEKYLLPFTLLGIAYALLFCDIFISDSFWLLLGGTTRAYTPDIHRVNPPVWFNWITAFFLLAAIALAFFRNKRNMVNYFKNRNKEIEWDDSIS